MRRVWYVGCCLLLTCSVALGQQSGICIIPNRNATYNFIISNLKNARLDCDNLEIVNRSEWGATKPKSVTPMKLPVPHAFIYHTVSRTCSDLASCSEVVRAIQKLHMFFGWSDIGYSFLVGGDGRVYEGRGWKRVEAACPNYNDVSLGVAFIGNFMYQIPKAEMVVAAYNLIGCGAEKGYFTKDFQIHGHRDATCTLSPGDCLYDIIMKWPHFVGGPLPHYSCKVFMYFLQQYLNMMTN